MEAAKENVGFPENSKKEIRKKVLTIRNAMPSEERIRYSGQIVERFLKTKLYQESDRIFCYVSFRSEVDTKELISQMLKDGKCVCVPRVDGKKMHFYEISGLMDCEKGSYGILEPKKDSKAAAFQEQMESTDSKDLMIVPGSAFSLRKERMGYGGGYYDRFLEEHPMCTIGFFFDCQKTDVLPCDQYDKKLSYIITETMFL